MDRVRNRVAIVAIALSCVVTGCTSAKVEAPSAPATAKSSFASQIDSNQNMTPEQKAAAKQQIQQLPDNALHASTK